MDDEKIAERKSRIIHQKAGSAPEWRSVGSITIVSPDLEKPLFLEEAGYTIFFYESKEQKLRSALIVLARLQRTDDWKLRFWLVFVAVLGVALTRAWYRLFGF